MMDARFLVCQVVCESVKMRWEDLFADLEAQLASEEAQVLEEVSEDVAAAEEGRTALLDRLRARVGRMIEVGLRTGEVRSGVLRDCGESWLVMSEHGRDVLVPFGGLTWLYPLEGVDATTSVALSRLGLGHALRAIAAGEGVVAVHTPGRALVGYLTRVARDHLDIELVPQATIVTVPFGAVVSVLL